MQYTIDNVEDMETAVLVFIVKDKAGSLTKVFENASEMEQKISEQYGLNFI